MDVNWHFVRHLSDRIIFSLYSHLTLVALSLSMCDLFSRCETERLLFGYWMSPSEISAIWLVRLNSSGASCTSKSGGCSILSALQVQAVLGFWEKTLIHRVYSVSTWPRLWLHTSQISDRNTLQFTLTQLQLLSHLPFVSVHQLELWGVFCSHFVNLNKSLWMMWSCLFWYCSVSCHMTQKAFDWFTLSWLISSSGWVPWGNYFAAPCN